MPIKSTLRNSWNRQNFWGLCCFLITARSELGVPQHPALTEVKNGMHLCDDFHWVSFLSWIEFPAVPYVWTDSSNAARDAQENGCHEERWWTGWNQSFGDQSSAKALQTLYDVTRSCRWKVLPNKPPLLSADVKKGWCLFSICDTTLALNCVLCSGEGEGEVHGVALLSPPVLSKGLAWKLHSGRS